MHWSLLQECNPKTVDAAGKVKGRFTGDPAHDYDPNAQPAAGGEEQEETFVPGVRWPWSVRYEHLLVSSVRCQWLF